MVSAKCQSLTKFQSNFMGLEVSGHGDNFCQMIYLIQLAAFLSDDLLIQLAAFNIH